MGDHSKRESQYKTTDSASLEDRSENSMVYNTLEAAKGIESSKESIASILDTPDELQGEVIGA